MILWWDNLFSVTIKLLPFYVSIIYCILFLQTSLFINSNYLFFDLFELCSHSLESSVTIRSCFGVFVFVLFFSFFWILWILRSLLECISRSRSYSYSQFCPALVGYLKLYPLKKAATSTRVWANSDNNRLLTQVWEKQITLLILLCSVIAFIVYLCCLFHIAWCMESFPIGNLSTLTNMKQSLKGFSQVRLILLLS